ncbi:unnamed protein product [Prunus armeniaca]
MRMAATKKERESSTQAKGGACVSNLLKVVDETVAEEDDAKNGAADEVAADLADQAVGVAKQMATFEEHVVEIGGAMEGIVDQVEAEEDAAYGRHPAWPTSPLGCCSWTIVSLTCISLRTLHRCHRVSPL